MKHLPQPMKNHELLSYCSFLKKTGGYTDAPLPDALQLLKKFQALSYLANSQHSAIYLVDYVQFRYLFLNCPGNSVMGYPQSVIQDGGPLYMLSLIHPEDLKVINEKLFPDTLRFCRAYQVLENESLSCTSTYRIKKANGEYTPVYQRSCFVSTTSDGYPLAALGTISEIGHIKTDTRIVHQVELLQESELPAQRVLLSNFYYPDEEIYTLSRREIDVLKCACSGLSSKQIADKLHISIHTINNHRKNMLEKTNCRNLPELLNHAIRWGLV